jgi:hypothetical protein
MKRIYSTSIATLLGLALLLTSFESYHPRAQASLQIHSEVFAKDARGLKVTAKKYNEKESKKYLNRNLISHGFQPIQVTIENNTSKTYVISRDGVSQPCASAQKVAMQVSKKGLPRSIALKVVSFFFLPAMIPSTVDGIYTFKTHMNMRQDYSAKGVKSYDEPIIPYSTAHRIIFVPKRELKEDLTITLLSENKKDALSFIHKIADQEEKVELKPVS